MANLLLLKELLPEEYKVLGTPTRVLVLSPFKTPFGYLEAVVEEQKDHFEVENTDIPYQMELVGLEKSLSRFKDFTMLPVQIEDGRIVLKVPKENNMKDLILLAKNVDSFIKDLYDFIQGLLRIREVRETLGGVEALIFKFEELKEDQKQKLIRKAEKLKYEIIDLYDEIKSRLVELENLVKRGKFAQADRLLHEALKKLGMLDHLRKEYEDITGKKIYEFHTEVLRNALFQLQEKIEGSS